MLPREHAPKKFCQHIDNAISASYGPDLIITHKCIDDKENEPLKVDIPKNMFSEKDPTILQRARHKELYNEVNGNIMYCAECDKTMSSVDIVNNSLKIWRDTVLPNKRTQHNRPDTIIPLSQARLDMAVYNFSYHMNSG